ncbi:MAG: hypothetical protein Aurels2KO_13680 [Aureliella sp.]
MMTRWMSFMVLLCLVLAGCAGEDTQKDAAKSTISEKAAAVQTDTSPRGKWTVTEALLYGEAAADRVGAEIEIRDDGTADWPMYGQAQTIDFKLADANEDGSIPYKIANSEDQPAMGGAGPRNGLLRILESGDMEMIEATSASQPVPPDFSEDTQNNAAFFRLKRA